MFEEANPLKQTNKYFEKLTTKSKNKNLFDVDVRERNLLGWISVSETKEKADGAREHGCWNTEYFVPNTFVLGEENIF